VIACDPANVSAPTDHPLAGPPATDSHQHPWTEPFVSVLAARRTAPRLVRRGTTWQLRADGEAPCVIDLADHDPDRRARQARAHGLERVVIAPSCPIGCESLPVHEATRLVDAYHDGVSELGTPPASWASAVLPFPDPDGVSARLGASAIGLCLPAGAFAEPSGWTRVASLLDILAMRSAPLFI